MSSLSWKVACCFLTVYGNSSFAQLKQKPPCAGNCAEEVVLFFLFILKIPYLHCPLMHLSHALTMSHEEV
jgi:hypothetical protein